MFKTPFVTGSVAAVAHKIGPRLKQLNGHPL